MSLPYAYSPNMWPSIIASIFMLGLVVFSYRHRDKPGALPFSIACLFGLMWSIGAIFEFTGVGINQKIFWRKFQVIFQFPSATAITCFLLEYAWPKRWLTRRNLVLLSIVPLMVVLLIITNNHHHLFWQGFDFNGALVAIPGPLMKYSLAYVFVIFALNMIVFVWLFIHSPQNRWPVVIMVIGQIMMRILYFIDIADRPFLSIPYASVGIATTSLMYVIVFFRFQIFGPIPLARQVAIKQLPIGMVVLDDQEKFQSLNPAAEQILKTTNKKSKGMKIGDVLPIYPHNHLTEDEAHPVEFSLDFESDKRSYTLDVEILKDWRGEHIGQLLMITDVTEQRKAHSKILKQASVLATLKEREIIARELHDDLAQVFAFMGTQGQTVQRLISQGDFATAESYLNRMVEVARTGEVDIRESILGMRLTFSEGGLLATLEKYLTQFQKNNTIQTELVKSENFEENLLDPMVEVQVLRVLQEALTNIRKHAQAHHVKIKFDIIDNSVCISIRDDGRGFDVVGKDDDSDDHFGIKMMRERMDTLGGTIHLTSQPGQGTEIRVCVPIDGVQVMG